MLKFNQVSKYRNAYAEGRVSFLDIRRQTGLSASATEQMLSGVTHKRSGGVISASFAGVTTMFAEEKRRDTEWRRQYMKSYNDKRTTEHRQRAISLLGDVCVFCGSVENLQFDHIDPETKLFHIGSQLGRKWESLEPEVLKCQLLCYACHKKKSGNETRRRRTFHRGERHVHARLTNRQVEDARQRFNDRNLGLTELAHELGLSEKCTRQMLRGETYTDVSGPLAHPSEAINYITPERKEQYRQHVLDLFSRGVTTLAKICKEVPISSHTAKAYLIEAGLLTKGTSLKGNRNQHRKLTNEQVRQYRELYAAGETTISAMAREIGMSVTGASRILRGRSYKGAGGPITE